MNINFIYDASVSSAPAGFITALNAVAQQASQIFADPITINIRVGWGEVNGQPLPSTEVGAIHITTLSINDVLAINNLPASDPFGGSFYISAAQQKAVAWSPLTRRNS